MRNHSSIAPGLAKVLDILKDRMPAGDTITPGRLSSTKGRRGQFALSFGAAGAVVGFKLIARVGKTAQEVFICTKMSREDMEGNIAWVVEKVHG